jgi:diguanylate cyclase (GGDEF)-like protein/PAS domain S-box-containing protein
MSESPSFIPANEAQRLQALRRFEILDTPPDHAFDRIVSLAARLLHVPISIVSLVDTDRVWFKSKHGIDAMETTRTPGLCASAILHDKPWIVSDASMDPRTLAHPLVAHESGFRFYAAIPLTTLDGYKLGTLCVIDYQPRELSDDEIGILQDLAALVMDEMELRLASRRAVRMDTVLHDQGRDLAQAQRMLASEAQRRYALDAAQIGDWDLDLSTNKVLGSALYAQCFGHHELPVNASFDSVMAHVHTDDRIRLKREFNEAKTVDGLLEGECRVIWPDQSCHWIWYRARFYCDVAGHSLHLAGIVSDITERKLNEQKIAHQALIMEKITTPVMLTDANCRIEWVNAPFATLTGYTMAEVIGRRPGDFLQGPDTDRNTVLQMHEAIAQHKSFEVEILNYQKSGQPFWQHLKVDPVFSDQGVLTSYVAVQSDITERKNFESRLWRNANFDPLTGLPNRRLFWDRLDHEVRHAHRNGQLAALFFIDLDRFKEINDLFGHEVGDRLLKEVANRIDTCVRESDTLARIGGDEFTLILSELVNTHYAERIAHKIISTLAKPFTCAKATLSISASIGIALYPADGKDAPELFRNADQAMYSAKSCGRNQFCYFTRSMQENSLMRLHTGRDLRNAMNPDQLKVFFQPIVAIPSRRILKAEALLRWQHPTRGLVAPSEFIPLAEELGLIHDIGEWVFHEATHWAKQFSHQCDRPFQVSVNTSPLQFTKLTRGMNWPAQMKSKGLPCSLISVEITEGVLLKDSPAVTEALHAFRQAGMEIALDDFGTGYSSMAYLVKFGLDYLKIDQSFVKNFANAHSRTIAETIIVMGHKLGLKIIAEGIETKEQFEMLAEAGCDYGQGFLFAPALPPEKFQALLGTDSSC